MLAKRYLVYLKIHDSFWYVKDFDKIRKGIGHNSLSRPYNKGATVTKENAILYINILNDRYNTNQFQFIDKSLLERIDKIKEILL